jgi:hypothetical protein
LCHVDLALLKTARAQKLERGEIRTIIRLVYPLTPTPAQESILAGAGLAR